MRDLIRRGRLHRRNEQLRAQSGALGLSAGRIACSECAASYPAFAAGGAALAPQARPRSGNAIRWIAQAQNMADATTPMNRLNRLPRRALAVVTTLWAAPNSVLGLLLAPLALARGGSIRLERGVLECAGGLVPSFLRLLGAGTSIHAVTLGHVVLAEHLTAMRACREHERVHVRQYEVYGPFFLPLYFASSLLALARGHHPYFRNHFERAAFEHAAARPDGAAVTTAEHSGSGGA